MDDRLAYYVKKIEPTDARYELYVKSARTDTQVLRHILDNEKKFEAMYQRHVTDTEKNRKIDAGNPFKKKLLKFLEEHTVVTQDGLFLAEDHGLNQNGSARKAL